jgi:hypothetical protein
MLSQVSGTNARGLCQDVDLLQSLIFPALFWLACLCQIGWLPRSRGGGMVLRTMVGICWQHRQTELS